MQKLCDDEGRADDEEVTVSPVVHKPVGIKAAAAAPVVDNAALKRRIGTL